MCFRLRVCVCLAALVTIGLLPPQARASWWDTNWGSRVTLTFDNSAQPEDLDGFPVLVVLDSTRVDYDKIQNLGQDVRFVDSDDSTLLPHEIEVWDEGGLSYVWVKVPRVDASSATDFIYMYFENGTALDAQNRTAVWDNRYAAVWHLDNDPTGGGPIVDSSANLEDGVGSASMDSTNVVSGRVGLGLEFDGVADYIRVSSDGTDSLSVSGDFLTVECWVKRNGSTPGSLWMVPIARQLGIDASDSYVLTLDRLDPSKAGIATTAGGHAQSLTGGIPDSTWKYVVGVQDVTNVTIYIDGSQAGQISSGGPIQTDANDVTFAAQENGVDSTVDTWFVGTMDEARISRVARSSRWIAAQHLSMTDAFITYGAAASNADLDVVKTVDNATPNELDTITYTVTVTNNGASSATGISITDLLPAGVTYVSDTPSQGSYVSGTGLWTVGTLANATNATLDITVTVDAGTVGSTIGNTASVTASDQSDSTPANNSDNVDITVQFTGPLVVDTAADSVDGDTSTLTSLMGNKGADGRISLREAITAANNTAGPDTIQFAMVLTDSGHVYYSDDSVPGTLSQIVHTTLNDATIPDFDPDYPGGAVAGYSWYRIHVEGTPLPAVTDTIFLDAESQTGFAGKPIVELDGSLLGGAGEDGFNISAGASTVRGFVINQFSGSGIELTTAGGNAVTGNHIGTDVTGLLDLGNGAHGIHVASDTGGNTIGGAAVSARNVISGNAANGIFLQASNTNIVQGNYIGADKNGAPNLGNDGHGILIEGGDDNAVGGTTADAGNLISGNVASGVAVRN